MKAIALRTIDKRINPLGLLRGVPGGFLFIIEIMENKKSFLLYADQKHVFDQLPNDLAWKLIKHLLSYVNDEDPQTDDLIIKVAFEPIKQQLKRDLEKRNDIKIKRSVAWSQWWRQKKAKKANASFDKQTKAKKAVNEDINKLLETVKLFNNGICDGTQKEQRQYGNLVLNKLKKIDKIANWDYAREAYFEGLLRTVNENEYHKHKIAWPKKIYYTLAELIQVANQTIKKTKTIPQFTSL